MLAAMLTDTRRRPWPNCPNSETVHQTPTGPPGLDILKEWRGRLPPSPFLRFHPMRKIERLMNAAITAGKDWKLANTEVIACSNVSDVYLHGNLIARIGETWIELFDGGWQSNTTKSRLNAILREHGIPGECVFQKNFQWFVAQEGGDIPFFSGMRLA